uniref:V-set domain containing T-cell activation inhibitor 1-like n=1 Tax=Agelaius phoeniceus TaxID=39638 RepID=UPI0023EDD770|nr:V-set domain containing T-cell activation inhibitor 1-like [Agelaius phoeniceus]
MAQLRYAKYCCPPPSEKESRANRWTAKTSIKGQLDTVCHAFVGETVVLPCTTTPPGELALSKSMLYWQIGTKQLVHFFQNGQDSLGGQDEKFHNRTSLFPDQMKHGNLSLKISNVQLGDDAEYSCIYRQTESHQTKKSTIKLNVSAAPRIEEPPSPSEQNQIPSGSPVDVPSLAVLPLPFLLLVPLGLWHL